MSHEGVTPRDFLKQTATGATVLALGAPRSIASGSNPSRSACVPTSTRTSCTTQPNGWLFSRAR